MRDTILIVDDEELNRELLRQMFEDKYKILTAADGKEGLKLLSQHINEVAIILLDLVMPVVDGFQVLQILFTRKIIEHIPVVLVTANDDNQTELKCYQMGASAVITKPFEARVVRKRVNDIVNMHHNMDNLQKRISEQESVLLEQKKQLERFNEGLIDVLSNIVEFRDAESGEHVKRVKGLTRILATAYQKLYPEENISSAWIDTVTKASALHDVGKICIPDSILLKPGKLTDEEREIMKSHTTKGCEILDQLAGVQDEEAHKASYEICRHHHERYDGSGYPDGLSGDDIPLSAQIVSVVDVYDALVSDRVYKKAYDKNKAYHMIVDGECGQFSPKMLECLGSVKSQMEDFSVTKYEAEYFA